MDGIWIRSQDDGLYRCIGFEPPSKKDYQKMVDEGKPVVITGVVTLDDKPWLGWYATKERAVEVLDDIQKHIFNGVHQVYQMPQE
jgi:hypothetical protein